LFSEITLPARLDSKIGTDFPHNTPIASELTPTNKIPNIKEIINNLTNLIFPAAYAYDAVKEEQVSPIAEANGQMGWRKVTDYLKNMVNDTVEIDGNSVDDTVSEVVTVVVNPADTVITIMNGVGDTVKSEESVNIQETKVEDAQTEVKVTLENMSDYIEKVTEEVKLVNSSMQDTADQVRENISSIKSLNTQDANRAKEFFGEVRVLVEELNNNLRATENSSDYKVLFEEFFNRLSDICRDYVEDLGQAANVRVVNEEGLKMEAKAEQKSEDTLVLSVKENITAGQKVNQEGAQSEVPDAGAAVITAQGMILPPARIDIPAGGAAVSAEAAVNTAGASVHNNINNSSVGIVSQTIYVNNNGISAEYNSEVNVLSDQNNPPTTTGPPRINCAAYALSAYYGISLEAAAAILSQYTTYNSSTKQYETSLEGLKIAAGLQAREFKVSEISQLNGKNLLVVNGNHVVEYDADNGIVKDNGSEMTLSAFLCKYGLNDDTVISGLVSVEVGSEMNAEKLANIKVSWGASWGAAASAAASSGSSGSYGGVSWGGSSGSSFSSGRSSGGSSSYGSVAGSFIGGSYSYSSGSYGGSDYSYSSDSSYSTSSALISSVVSNFSSFSYTSYSDTSYNVAAPAFNFNAISTISLSNYAPIYSTSFSLAPSVIANFSAFSSALSSSLTLGQTMYAFGGGFFGGTANVGNPVSLQDFSFNPGSYGPDVQTQVFTAFGGANYAQVQPMIGAAMNGGITHIDLNPGNEYGATSLEINGSSAVIATPSFISNSVSAAQGNADTFSAYCQITAAHETTEAETGSHYQALTAEAHVAQKSNLTAEQLSSWYETLHSGYENEVNKAESYASRMMLAAGIAAEGDTFVKALDEAEKALNLVTEIGTPAQQQAAYVMQGDLFLALDKAVNASKADNSAEVKEVNYEARAKESYEKASAMDTEHLVSMYANYMLMQMATNEENINLLMGKSKEALDRALQDDTLKADTMLSFLLSNNLLPADRYVELCYVMSCSLGKMEGTDTAGNSPMLQLSWLDKAASRIETAGEGHVNTDLAGNVYLQKSDLEYNISLLTGDNFYKELAYTDIERAEELNPSDKAVWENHLQYLLADKDYDKFNALLTDISHNNIALSPQDNASIVGTYGQHFLWDTLKANNNADEKTMGILKEQGWYECFIQSIQAQAYHAGLESEDGSSFYANWTLSKDGVWHVLVLQSSGVWDANAVVMGTNPYTGEEVNLNDPAVMANMILIAPEIDGRVGDFYMPFSSFDSLLVGTTDKTEDQTNEWGGLGKGGSADSKKSGVTTQLMTDPANPVTPVVDATQSTTPVEISGSTLSGEVKGVDGFTDNSGEGVVVKANPEAKVDDNNIADLEVHVNKGQVENNQGNILDVYGNGNKISGNKMQEEVNSHGSYNVLTANETSGFLTSEGDGNSLYGNFASLGIESIGDDNDIVNNRTEGDLKSVGDYNDIFSNTVGGNLSSSGEHNEIGYNSVAGNLISTGDYNTLVSNTVVGSMYSIGDRNTLGYNKVGENIVSIGDYNTLMSNTVAGSLYSTGDRNILEYNQVGGDIVSSGDYNTVAFNTVAGSVYSEGVRNTIEYNQVGGNIYSIGSYNVIEHNIVGGDIVSSGDYNTINYNQVGGSVYSAGNYNTLTNNLIAGDMVSYGDYNLIGANQIGGSLFSTGDNNSVISNIVTGDINVSGNNNYISGNIAGGVVSVSGINNIFGMNVQLSELAGDITTQGNILFEGVNDGFIQRIIDTLLIGVLNLSTWGDQTGGSVHASANGAATGALLSGSGQGNSAAVNAVMEAIGFTIKDSAAALGQYVNRGSVSAQEGAVSATGKRGEGGDISYSGTARAGFAELGREITAAAKSAYEKAGETVKEISGSKFSPVEVKDEQSQENNNPLMRAQEVINAQNKMADAFDRLQEVSATAKSAVDLPYNPAEAVSGGAGRSGADGSGNPSIKGSNTIINQYPGLTGGILNSNRAVSEWAEGSLSGRGPPEGTLSLFSSIISASKSVISIPDSSNPDSSTINNTIDSLNGIIGKLTADGSSGTVSSSINGDFRGQGPDASSYLEAPALIVSSAASDLTNTNNAQSTQTKGGESWVSSILSSQTTASHFLAAVMVLAGRVSSTFSANRSGDTSTAGGKTSAGNLPTRSGSLSAAAETAVRPSGSDSSAVFSDERLSVKSSDSAPGTAEALAAMESWNGILLNGDKSYSEYISATSRNAEDIKSSAQEQSWTYVKGTSFAVQAPSNSGRYSIGVYGSGAQAAAEAKTGAGSVLSSIASETAQNGENTLSRDYIMADTDNDGRGDSKVITAGRVYNSAGREVYHADYIGKSFTVAEFDGEALTVKESITFNPDNSLGRYSRESGFTAISGINAEIASDTWQIDYNKSESVHEVLNATDTPGEYISTITVRGAGGEEITIAGTKDYSSITGDGGWKSDTAGSIVSHGETLGSYQRMAEYEAGGVLREYSGRLDFNESGAAAGYRDQTFGAELDVTGEGVLSGLAISYEMDGSNGDKLADYSYLISDIDYLGRGTVSADEGFYTHAAFGQMFEECFAVDMFNMETVYDFARENGVQSYTYDFSYDGRIGGKEEGAGEGMALSERMSGSWQLLESSVMRGGYAWSEKGEYAEQYTDSAGVENNTGLAAAKAYTFEQHYVDAKGLTLPAGTVESGYGLMRMDGGVFSMAVVKGEAVAADGVRRSVYYGVAIGEARGETGSDAGSASGLGMGESNLKNYLEEYYTPETMQGAGAFDIEVNLVLLAGDNGEIFGFNKDYMLTGGQVSSPEYEMSGMPYGWYAWHCEGAISPVLQNPNHQVPGSLRTDDTLAAQYASQAYPAGNYVYYPVGSVNGQVVGVYMTYQDNENNYLLGQAVVPTGDGRSYIYNIYTANPGYYGDNASWQAANRYIVDTLENNGPAIFGVQNLAFTRAGDPANPSQYIPLSRVREYNGSDCSMYPQDKSFAKAMGFSYSENLAQMPREIETFWMTNSRVSQQELSCNQWVKNPLRNMVQAGSLTALGNYVLGGEMEYGCCWEGVLTLVDRGVDGDVYANNRGNYYKAIGIGGFMITTVPVVNVEGLGWKEYITDANNNIFVQYAPASYEGSAIYAYYDQSTGRAVTDSADSFMRFYQVEGVGVLPVTVGLTGEGWVPLGSAQAEGEQVWVTPVQGGENIYERLEYDAPAQTPWAGTGEYYRQDGQENWVKTTAPAAAVTLEERVFDCEKYSALTYGRENKIGYNADNDCAALAYAYLAAGNSGKEISEKEFFGLADNFKAASGMNEDGVSIEQMLKGFYSLGMNYKYEEVGNLKGLEAGAVILTEEDGMLHAMVLAGSSGPLAAVYTCEEGWNKGGVALENIDPEELTIKGALIPAGTDASGLDRSREITISVSSPGSIFYDNDSSYLYTEIYFDAKGQVTGSTGRTFDDSAYFSGSVRAVSHDGWSADKLSLFFGGDWWQEGDIKLVGEDFEYKGSIEKAYALRADYYAAAGMSVPDIGYTFAEVSKDAVAEAPAEYREYTGSLFDINGDNNTELAVRSDLLADAEVLAAIMIHEDTHINGQNELAARQEEIKFAVWEALDSYYPSAEEAMEALSIGIGSEDWNTRALACGVIESFSSVIGSIIKESDASDGLRIYGFYVLNSAYEVSSHPINPAEDTLKIVLDDIRADEKTMDFFYRQVALEEDFSSVLPAVKQYFGGDYSLPLAMAAYNNYNNLHGLHTEDSPRTLALLPRYDYQNPDYHFYGSAGIIIRDLCLGGGTACQVMVYVVPDEGSFIRAIQTAAGYDAETGVSSKPMDTIVLNGHGQRSNFRLGSDNDDGMIDTSDKKELSCIQSSLKNGGTVVINSCSTGEGGLKGGNLANTIAAVFPQAAHVYAADALSFNLEVHFDEQGYISGVDLDTVTTWDFALKQRPEEGEDLSLFVATVAASTGGTIGTSAGALRNSDLVTAVFGDGSTYYIGYDNSRKAQEAGKRLAALDDDSMVTAGVGANIHCSGCSIETYYGPNLAPAPAANILTAGGKETLPLRRSI
jgi:hypothetical protein